MPNRKPFRPFLDMIYHGIPDASLAADEAAVDELVGDRGRARLFLGHYTEDDIRDVFKRFSIQQRLDEMGLGNYKLTMNASNPDKQELRLYPAGVAHADNADPDQQEPIAEVILREALLSPSQTIDPAAKPCPYLVIQWICLQNPLATFDREKLLPGQKFPGLGVGVKVLLVFEALINNLHLEGIINRPEFLHNAILYSRVFQFINPEAQGRLNALRRQLSALTLWQIAWAAHEGHIVEDGQRTYFPWYQSEQVWANCKHITAYFESPRYQQMLKEAEAKATYTLSPDTPKKYLL